MSVPSSTLRRLHRDAPALRSKRDNVFRMIGAVALALLAVGAYVMFSEHEPATLELPSPSFVPATADLTTV